MSAKAMFTRRRMLATLGIGTAAFVLRDFVVPPAARADAKGGAPKGPFLIFCYFSGGWDTLLSLDPRDHQAFGGAGGDIETAYDKVNDTGVRAVLDKNPKGLVRPAGSQIAFGPAIGKLAAHYADLCVVRGLDMQSLTHEVGRRYFLTGKFPRGLAASGSSLPTVFVADTADATPVPNLVMGVETYNDGLTPAANGLVIRGAGDLAGMLKPLDAGDSLDPAVAAKIRDYVAAERCADRRFDGSGLVTTYQTSREKAAILGSGELFQYFDFRANPSAEIASLYEAFGIDPKNPAADLATAKGQAAVAAQAITNGVSQAVSIEIAKGLDTHDSDWEDDHAPLLRSGFDTLADLIAYLKKKPFGAGSFWDETVIVAFSEFARTPKRNSRGGRDHHLASACLVAGKGIKGNTVIGQTDKSYGVVPYKGTRLRPADVHATVLDAIGYSTEHLSNQSPTIIDAMKKG